MNSYSPLRYPGGKAKTYKKIVELLEKNNLYGCTYIEPFAGGSGLALKLLMNNKVDKVILNDIDYNLFTFWKTVLNNSEELINLINKTTISFDERSKQRQIYLKPDEYNELEVAYSFIYLNRVNRAGILKGGPIYKEEDKLGLRFKKDDLIYKIKNISKLKNKIFFYNLDAIVFLNKIVSKQKRKTFIFLDPPYYGMGKGLYTKFYNHADHQELHDIIVKINKRHDWIVTYDDNEEIKKMYNDVNRDTYNLRYSAYESRIGKEQIFYSENLIPIDMNTR